MTISPAPAMSPFQAIVMAILQGMTELRELDLRNTRVTDAGVKRLQQALPALKVTR